MGHGVNQRALIKMTPEEVDEFLHGRRSMTMSTISPDDSIHSVAMWYGFLEGKIAVESKAKAQKVKNLERDPRLTCLVEAGETYDQLHGVSLVGRARSSLIPTVCGSSASPCSSATTRRTPRR